MARIKTGSIVSDISGKVGTEIYSRNKGGPYVKNWAAPTIPFSTFRDQARNALKDANTAWNNSTESQRVSWSNFSDQFLKSSFYDGYRKIDPRSAFIGSFIRQSYIGVTPAPFPSFPVSPGFVSFDIDLGNPFGPTLTLNGGTANSNYRVIWSASAAVNVSVRSPNTVPFYNIGWTAYAPGVPYSFNANYTTRFGVLPLAPATRLFFKASVVHILSGLIVGSFISDSLFLGTETPFIAGSNFLPGSNSTRADGFCKSFLAAYDGYISSISFYGGAIAGQMELAIYSHLGGQPNILLGSTGSLTVSAGYNWYNVLLPSPIGITAGSVYWYAVFTPSTTYYNFVTGGTVWKTCPAGTFPAPAVYSVSSSSNRTMAMYCSGFYYV